MVVADGNRVEDPHGLHKLWRHAEKDAGKLPASLTENDRKRLSKDGGGEVPISGP